MKNRTFIIGAPIKTTSLVAVHLEGVGMVRYACDRPISDTFVHIEEHGYFVRYNFFTMGYEDYVTAAGYLELPVITNYAYNEYAAQLEKEYAIAQALKGAFTDKQFEALKQGLEKLDAAFPGELIRAEDDYDDVVANILCIKRCAVMEGDKPFDVGTVIIKERETYTRLQHYALYLICNSKQY
jgi:hypothetical protein